MRMRSAVNMPIAAEATAVTHSLGVGDRSVLRDTVL